MGCFVGTHKTHTHWSRQIIRTSNQQPPVQMQYLKNELKNQRQKKKKKGFQSVEF